MKRIAEKRSRGRPREFEMNDSLDAALLVFRERGYHAASMSDLSEAMNLSAGSLYKAFENKRAIFLAAFDRYVQLRDSELLPQFQGQETGVERLRTLLHFYVDLSSGDEGRRGCLVVGSATAITTFDREMADRVTAAMLRVESRLRDLLRLGQSDGSVSRHCDIDATAIALLSLLQGFRVVGKTSRKRSQLRAAADQILDLLT